MCHYQVKQRLVPGLQFAGVNVDLLLLSAGGCRELFRSLFLVSLVPLLLLSTGSLSSITFSPWLLLNFSNCIKCVREEVEGDYVSCEPKEFQKLLRTIISVGCVY